MQDHPLSIPHAKSTMIGMNRLGALVRRHRELAGYRTQKAFADAWGKDQSFVSKVENGQAKETLSPADMHRLRDLIGVQVLDLLAASGYELEGSDDDADPVMSELAEHARIVDWHADSSRLPVMHAILSTWAEFDRNSLRQVAESAPDYDE